MKRFNCIKEQRGFTLVEVIISLAILGIITVSIITIFSGSFSNIFSLGNRSKALAEASHKMEILYTLPVGERNLNSIKTNLEGEGAIYVEGADALYQSTTENVIRFTLQSKKLLPSHPEENTGYLVTIVVFYQKGERNITLNTFLRGGI